MRCYSTLIGTLSASSVACLMRETDLIVTAIAVASGFSSSVVFTKSFHARFGYSPAKGRKAT